MAKLYESLMRGSFGEQVTWPEEWEKATQAKTDLFKIIDAIPSVLDILRSMLEGELKRLGKTVDIDKVYINTDPAFPADENRPSGTLWDVTVHCLNNHISPAYIMGGDGVFVLPDTFSELLKI